jgi:regulator of sigma E protease
MQFLETVFYFVVTLGVLVFIHELGHFLAAKLFGIRVDRFSIGFPPRAFGKKFGDTDYCVSWVPIGGYVKIAGMIDESFDTEFINNAPEPWEFRSKPVWQRMIVMVAGVVMNIFLAVAIFWGINYSQGRSVRETTTIGYVLDDSPAARAGLRSGDRVVSINDQPIKNWDDILTGVYIETLGRDITMVIARGGVEQSIFIARSAVPDPGQTPFGIVPEKTNVVVTTVEPGMPADKIGMKMGDVIVHLDTMAIRYDGRVRDVVKAHAGKRLFVEWRRGETVMHDSTTPTADGRIGIGFTAQYDGVISRVEYSLPAAFWQGAKDVINVSGLFVQQMWQIVTGKAALKDSVGGPVRIAQMATQSAEHGIVTYLGFMALLSMSLAILNVLPFPALDGGHLVILLYEWIFRRDLPVKVKIGIQKAGFVLLLVFMAFVLYNDLIH